MMIQCSYPPTKKSDICLCLASVLKAIIPIIKFHRGSIIRHVMAFLMLMPQNSFQVGFYFTGCVHAEIHSLQAMS